MLWLGVQGYAERTGGGQDGDEDTSKMSLRQLKLLLAARHGMAAALAAFDDMELVIIRSLLAVQKIMINDKHCFVRTLTPPHHHHHHHHHLGAVFRLSSV